MLTIRTATPADARVIAEGNCRLAWESEKKTLEPAIVTAGVSAAIADPDAKGPYYLACDGPAVVGQCQVTREWSDWRNRWVWWLQGVYVRADRRGAGIFRALCEHIRAEALFAGDVLMIRLYVHQSNAPARAVYERLGFQDENYDLMRWDVR